MARENAAQKPETDLCRGVLVFAVLSQLHEQIVTDLATLSFIGHYLSPNA